MFAFRLVLCTICTDFLSKCASGGIVLKNCNVPTINLCYRKILHVCNFNMYCSFFSKLQLCFYMILICKLNLRAILRPHIQPVYAIVYIQLAQCTLQCKRKLHKNVFKVYTLVLRIPNIATSRVLLQIIAVLDAYGLQRICESYRRSVKVLFHSNIVTIPYRSSLNGL